MTKPVRNILFIIADQWRGDTLGALGHPCVRTPNLDALAADGVMFRNHYAQASPCGPARALILTGLYMFNHRQVANETPLDASLPNLARIAREAGHDPTLFGYTIRRWARKVPAPRVGCAPASRRRRRSCSATASPGGVNFWPREAMTFPTIPAGCSCRPAASIPTT